MKIIFPGAAVAVATLLLATRLDAQDEAAAEAAPAAPQLTLPAEANPFDTWKKLQTRRIEIFNELQAMKKEFAAAQGSDEKRQIRDGYVKLITEFDVEIYPEMIELSDAVYAEHPDELDAGEIVLRRSFREHDYAKAADVAAKLLAAGRKTVDVLSYGGVARFAIQDFESARGILAEAVRLNRLSSDYSLYPDSVEQCVSLWKAEQEIRTRQAELTGDQALPQVALTTQRGKIVLELFEDEAPNTVANFVSLTESGKYDGTKFHRIVPGFVAQGGDPNSKDDDPSNDGYGGPGYSIKCECYREDARMHFQGSLSMAHSGPDTGGSQFFITHMPTPNLNPAAAPERRGHTVFGRVIEGMDVVYALERGDVIEKAEVLRKRPHDYKPEIVPDEPLPSPDGGEAPKDEGQEGSSAADSKDSGSSESDSPVSR